MAGLILVRTFGAEAEETPCGGASGVGVERGTLLNKQWVVPGRVSPRFPDASSGFVSQQQFRYSIFSREVFKVGARID